MTKNNRNIPDLRFKEFGELWGLKSMGELGTFMGGGTPSTNVDKYWVGTIPWISSSDIFEDDLHNININRFLNEDAISESATKIIPKNSVLLISRVGVGKLAINKFELCTSQDFANFIPLKCDSYFIGYFILNKKKLLLNFSQGTSIKGFTTSDIKSLKIHIPTLPEQQKIASFLSSIDEKIQQLTRKKELLEQYKKGVMQQIFSGKLRFKSENGKAFPEWEEKRLGDVCTINPSSNQLPEAFIYIDLESVEKGVLLKENRIQRSEAPSRAQRKLLPNDILYQTVRPYQMNNLLFDRQGNYVASTGYALIRTKENPRFVFQLLHTDTFVNEVIERCTGTSFPAINSKDLGRINVGIPCKEEQQKIANYLSAMDTKIESVANQITQTQTFKKGLLQGMFV